MIGDISRFSSRLQERIRRSEALTENNDGLTLNIAANYGGRWDIIQGVRELAERVRVGELHPDQISEELLSERVCMSDRRRWIWLSAPVASIASVTSCCGKSPMLNFTLRMCSGLISMNLSLKVR